MTHPEKLGKYQIKRELGRGAMGVVYEAFDPFIERVVALKTIRKSFIEEDEHKEIFLRFRREAQAAGRLTHPNIVSIYEYGEDQDVAFIAMEFVQGKTLKDFFEEKARFPVSEIIRTLSQLLEALSFSHKQGVVHRDIKPANIILMADGTVKVADFGIARIESSNLTQTGAVLGTPSYMSPEQFEGQTLDGRSDLFSAGVVLYQLLTGEKPFEGSSTTTIMYKVLTEEPVVPSKLNVNISPQFDVITQKALAKRPEQRYQTAAEFLEQLKTVKTNAVVVPTANFKSGEATVVNAHSVRTQSVKRAKSQAPQTVSAITPKKSFPVALVMVLAIIVIGLGATFYLVFDKVKALTTQAVIAKVTSPTEPSETASPGPAPVTQTIQPIKMEIPSPTSNPTPISTEPGVLVISAIGLADPLNQKYATDQSLLQADARTDSQQQMIEKAIALYLDKASLTQNYALLKEKLLNQSQIFIKDIVHENTPQLGKEGLMHIMTKAKVKVRDVQKSLNQMTKEDRIDFIRNNGDPKITVRIAVRNSEQGAAQPSPIAENIVKEKIKAFGYRVWDSNATEKGNAADFEIVGEAKIKKLSAKLEASGITIEKFTLTSWTVKCTDKQTGEEIYYNNKTPEKISWANEDAALTAIGKLIGDEFSKDFFAQHFNAGAKTIGLQVQGLPGKANQELLQNELLNMRPVIGISSNFVDAYTANYQIQVSSVESNISSLITNSLLKPLNSKFAKSCFNVVSVAENQAVVSFDKTCADNTNLNKLETLPPAALYDAPPARQKSIIKNPELLKKLSI